MPCARADEQPLELLALPLRFQRICNTPMGAEPRRLGLIAAIFALAEKRHIDAGGRKTDKSRTVKLQSTLIFANEL